MTLLIVISVFALIAGFVLTPLPQFVMGVAVWSAVIARIAQASDHHAEQLAAIRGKEPDSASDE